MATISSILPDGFRRGSGSLPLLKGAAIFSFFSEDKSAVGLPSAWGSMAEGFAGGGGFPLGTPARRVCRLPEVGLVLNQ